jgi:hypothetical protein
MSKKNLYYNEAEQLYVTQQLNFNEIADRLKLNEKTIRNWKTKDWDIKRKQFLKNQESLHEKSYNLQQMLLSSIEHDLEREEAIKGFRKKIEHEKLSSLLTNKELTTWEEVIPVLIEVNFEIEDLFKLIEWALVGDFTVSSTRINFVKGMKLKEVKEYEDGKEQEEEDSKKDNQEDWKTVMKDIKKEAFGVG